MDRLTREGNYRDPSFYLRTLERDKQTKPNDINLNESLGFRFHEVLLRRKHIRKFIKRFVRNLDFSDL